MNTLYDIITILPFSLLALMLFGEYAGISEQNIFRYILCLVFTLFLILLRHMKRKERICSIGIAAFFLGGLFLAAGTEYRRLFLTEYIWVIRIAGISLAAMFVGILMNRNIWIRRAAAAALLIYCIVGVILKSKIEKAPFALICLILLIGLTEEIQRTWQKSGTTEMKGHITRTAPFLLALCLLIYAVPAPDHPYDWQFVKDFYHSSVTLINRIYGSIMHPNDDYAVMGFSDQGGFASKLRTNDDDVLFIHTDHTTLQYFRLVGCMSNDFTGREWVFNSEDTHYSRMMDTMETVTAVKQFAPSDRTDYLQKVNMQYESRLYNTHYLFSPAKIKLEDTQKTNFVICEQNGSIVSKNKIKYLDTYTVYCYELNYANPQFADLLTMAEPIREEEWKDTAAAECPQRNRGYSFADYQQYRRDVYAYNCHSYGVSDAVSTIIEEIENSTPNRYDAMKKLEAYLKNMEYSTDCGALPDFVSDAESFLDYFLFTSKKGYCTHFATAFVLMANEMGIPCRYVQGYNVTSDGGGDITVKQSSAHAWPEVYFDHVGWVAFEPTPGYSIQEGWGVSSSDSFAPFTDYEALYRRDPQIPQDIQEKDDEEPTHINPLIIIIPSLSVLGFLLLFFIISRSVSKRKYAQMRPNEKFMYLAQLNLRYFGYLGFRMEDETLAEFADRILQADRAELCAHLDFIPIYETVLYSDREITTDEIKAAEHTAHALRSIVKKAKLRFRLVLMIKKM